MCQKARAGRKRNHVRMTKPSRPEAANQFDDDLGNVLTLAWAMLARGAKDRRTPAHTPVLATVDEQGRPRMRTVVLRACDEERRMLRFHTDIRSRKIADIAHSPEGAVHIYDPGRKMQLRLACVLEVHPDGPENEAAWAASTDLARTCYQVTGAPGSPVSLPAEVHFDPEAAGGGRGNFAILLARIQEIEWLYLHIDGHRRARFAPDGGAWQGQWLTP